MIQRKQTLYLIFVILLLAATFFTPFAKGIVASPQQELYEIYKIYPYGVFGTTAEDSLFSTLLLTVTIGISILWSVFIISRYKNRWLQIRLTVFLIILLVCTEGLMVIYGYKLTSALNQISETQNAFPMSYGALLPIAAIFFAYLAFRGILRDELLIKSLNRMR